MYGIELMETNTSSPKASITPEEELLLRWQIVDKLIPVFGGDNIGGLLATAEELIKFVRGK